MRAPLAKGYDSAAFERAIAQPILTNAAYGMENPRWEGQRLSQAPRPSQQRKVALTGNTRLESARQLLKTILPEIKITAPATKLAPGLSRNAAGSPISDGVPNRFIDAPC